MQVLADASDGSCTRYLTDMGLKLFIKDCGLINYSDCLNLQLDLCEQRQAGKIDNTVLLAEHPAVITFGARQEKNLLLQPDQEVKKQGVDIVSIRRGGGATAHNPGQIVIYPILDLKDLSLGINEYVRQLEQIGIELLTKYSVAVDRKKSFPGLWASEEKIASIGVQVKKWVTFHGMAINISNDLSIFEKIVPCGLEGVKMTSILKLTGKTADMTAVKKDLYEIITKYWT